MVKIVDSGIRNILLLKTSYRDVQCRVESANYNNYRVRLIVIIIVFTNQSHRTRQVNCNLFVFLATHSNPLSRIVVSRQDPYNQGNKSLMLRAWPKLKTSVEYASNLNVISKIKISTWCKMKSAVMIAVSTVNNWLTIKLNATNKRLVVKTVRYPIKWCIVMIK